MYTIFIMKLLKYNYIFWLKKADSIQYQLCATRRREYELKDLVLSQI